MLLCRDLFPSNPFEINAKLLLEKEFSGNAEDNHKFESVKQFDKQQIN